MDNTGIRMQTSHRKSLHPLAVQSAVSKLSAHKAILKLHKHKITVTQQMFPKNQEARSQYCRQFQKLVASGFFDSENMCFTGKVLYTLNANVTNQNNKYWCLRNSHSACKVLCGMKLKSGAVSAESKGLCLSRKCEVPTRTFN